MSRKKSPPKRKYTTQGTKSLKEIQKYQKSTDLLMRKLPFIRLVREISRRVSGKEYRFQVAAMQCLQGNFLLKFFIKTVFFWKNLVIKFRDHSIFRSRRNIHCQHVSSGSALCYSLQEGHCHAKRYRTSQKTSGNLLKIQLL